MQKIRKYMMTLIITFSFGLFVCIRYNLMVNTVSSKKGGNNHISVDTYGKEFPETQDIESEKSNNLINPYEKEVFKKQNMKRTDKVQLDNLPKEVKTLQQNNINKHKSFQNKSAQNAKFQNHKKILLWSYFRGGSTFAMTVLSANNARFVYEPLKPYRYYPVDWKKLLTVLDTTFSCMAHPIKCTQHPYSIVKVNRLESVQGRQWLLDHPNIKVVHLLRDPRAVIASRQKLGCKNMKFKRPNLRSLLECHPEKVCGNMMKDIQELKKLPQDRYKMVKYEDLVDDSDATLAEVYKFMEIPYNNRMVAKYMKKIKPDQHGAYSVVRDSSFDKDKWAKKFNKETLYDIELHCSELLHYLKYKTKAIN